MGAGHAISADLGGETTVSKVASAGPELAFLCRAALSLTAASRCGPPTSTCCPARLGDARGVSAGLIGRLLVRVVEGRGPRPIRANGLCGRRTHLAGCRPFPPYSPPPSPPLPAPS